MRLLGLVLMIFSVTAFAKSDQEMVDALMSNPSLSVGGIEESDIRRGFRAASFVLGKAITKECSVYLEGFAVMGVDDDCNDGDGQRLASGDLKNLYPPENKKGAKNISIFLDTDTDADGDGYGDLSLYQRFVDNAFSNFVPKAAEAQDHNSSRSNKSSSRMDIVIASLDVLRGHESELVNIFQGSADSERLVQELSEKMATLEMDPKYTALLYKDFIESLKSIHQNEEKDRKLASLEQSDILYAKIAKLARLPESVVREIMKSATAITLKEIAIGGTVEFPEFGTIAVDRGEIISDTASRVGRNPQTGKEIKIAAKRVAKFKAGKALAETVK